MLSAVVMTDVPNVISGKSMFRFEVAFVRFSVELWFEPRQMMHSVFVSIVVYVCFVVFVFFCYVLLQNYEFLRIFR